MTRAVRAASRATAAETTAIEHGATDEAGWTRAIHVHVRPTAETVQPAGVYSRMWHV